MIVVSDTSVLNALVKVDLIHLLPQLFGQVRIPERVHQELAADAVLRAWLTTQPSWLVTTAVEATPLLEEAYQFVDRGEAEAIMLAKELNADRLLIDDLAGRKLAERWGIPLVGTGGVLLIAKQRKLISSVSEALIQLQAEVNFRLSDSVRILILRQAGE